MVKDTIIGIMFCKNEGDILNEILENIATRVDKLYIADDGSSDNSFCIIKDFQNAHKSLVEHIQQEPNKNDPGQRTSLLNKIRKRYKPENTWVQVCEADVVLLYDPKYAIANYARHNMAVTWVMLNGVRQPGTWSNVDTYPNWSSSIKEILPYGHYLERLIYTFRPLPDLHYSPFRWAPAPMGWSKYVGSAKVKDSEVGKGTPLLAHYGYRGPTHFQKKYKHMGEFHSKYKTWNLSNKETIEKTCSFFSGEWNNPNKIFPLTVEGWQGNIGKGS